MPLGLLHPGQMGASLGDAAHRPHRGAVGLGRAQRRHSRSERRLAGLTDAGELIGPLSSTVRRSSSRFAHLTPPWLVGRRASLPRSFSGNLRRRQRGLSNYRSNRSAPRSKTTAHASSTAASSAPPRRSHGKTRLYLAGESSPQCCRGLRRLGPRRRDSQPPILLRPPL